MGGDGGDLILKGGVVTSYFTSCAGGLHLEDLLCSFQNPLPPPDNLKFINKPKKIESHFHSQSSLLWLQQ